MRTRLLWLLLPLAAAGCAQGVPSSLPLPVQAAAANYPPMILYGTVLPTDGHEPPRSCATAGSRVEAKGGPTFVFGGADPSNPDLCLMTIDGQPAKAWYDIWLTDWPGADDGHRALKQVLNGPSGTLTGFATHVAAGRDYYDLIRNEGVEDIWLLNKPYHALKISHYREGANGNNYRSVSTVWKDIPTGMLIYGTYQHISGTPVIDDPLIPNVIAPAR
jgi:hypothetical protein